MASCIRSATEYSASGHYSFITLAVSQIDYVQKKNINSLKYYRYSTQPFRSEHKSLSFTARRSSLCGTRNWFILLFLFSPCRVLKPPGGGSSDLFGGSVPSTPRSIRNNMASNIFATPSDVKNGNGKSHTSPARCQPPSMLSLSIRLFSNRICFTVRFRTKLRYLYNHYLYFNCKWPHANDLNYYLFYFSFFLFLLPFPFDIFHTSRIHHMKMHCLSVAVFFFSSYSFCHLADRQGSYRYFFIGTFENKWVFFCQNTQRKIDKNI